MSHLLGGTKSQSYQQPAVSGLDIQTSAYGMCIRQVYGTVRAAPNLLWYDDFKATAQQSSAGSGGKGGVGGGGGGKGGGGSVSYTYSTSLLYGLCEGPIIGVGKIWKDKNITSPATEGFTISNGTYPQSAWEYLITNHPDKAIGYNGVAWAAAANYQLGNSANLANHNFEIKGLFSDSVNGLDADPSLVVNAILTSPKFGTGVPSGKIGDLSTYQNYTLAAGLLISLALETQDQVGSTLETIAACTNSAWFVASGKINIAPYGDEPLTGNGKTYTPPAAPEFDLTDDDFVLKNPTDDPVVMTRKSPTDADNWMQMEYADRSNSYNTAIVEAKNQTWIDLFGLRPTPDNGQNTHVFADGLIAQIALNMLLQRQMILNTYQFTLDQRYIVLDQMDIVTLTDTAMGLLKRPVRIIDIEENDDLTLTFTAEDYLGGIGHAAQYSFQAGFGYEANYNSDPPPVNPPVIFEPPVQIAVSNPLEVWMAVSAEPNWGGCDVWVSSDNSNYKHVGRITGPARQGYLSLPLAAGSDPDTLNTLAVDLTTSKGELLSGTTVDADQGHTLCYVDGELVSYRDAMLTAANQYNLTYLRRGMYGTTVSPHAKDTQFARLDGGIFTYPYDKSQIGQTIYIKFLSFNIWGGAEQSLADVDPYTHTILGPPPPLNVQNFSAIQVGDNVTFRWEDTSASDLYDIGYAPQGETNWSNFRMLTEAAKGTEMTNAAVPPGTWTFGIRARNVADRLSPEISTYDLVVVDNGNKILLKDNAPDFTGTLSGFVKHWTGKLVIDSQFPASHYSDWSVFDKYVPDPVSTASYITPIFDIGFTDNVRVFSTPTSALGPGESGGPTINTYLDHWKDGEVDPNTFTSWDSAFVEMRYGKMKLEFTGITEGHAKYVSDYSVEVDRAETTTDTGSATIAPGGSVINFNKTFHVPPKVTPSFVGASPRYATASSISLTQATIDVWDSSDTSVGGPVTWVAEGE